MIGVAGQRRDSGQPIAHLRSNEGQLASQPARFVRLVFSRRVRATRGPGTYTNGARLFWSVEPLIVAAAASHRNDFFVDLDSSGSAVIHDTFLLGRSAEDPRAAVLRSQMGITLDHIPLFEDGLDTAAAGAHGPSGLHHMRFVSTVIAAGWRPSAIPGCMPLAGEGSLVRSIGVDATSCGTGVADAAASWWAELLGSA